jgi:cytochrome c peroxidase
MNHRILLGACLDQPIRTCFQVWMLVCLIVSCSCQTSDHVPTPPVPYQVAVPEQLASSLPSPPQNPMTIQGVSLGKQLFFDPRLSGNNQVSCATCHRPELSYSDGRTTSVGVSGKPLVRHTPALINLAWASGYFWDGGAKTLESQVFGPLTNPDEMGQSPTELVQELQAEPGYVTAFAQAFPDGITINNVVRAIAQFERSLIVCHSRYDRVVRHEPGASFSNQETQGWQVFEMHCARCHVPDFFTDFSYHNNGLDDSFSEEHERISWGRGRITGKVDQGKFKTPSLRNVARTAPYMHDGRFATLEQVINHYRYRIKPFPTLDSKLGELPGIMLDDEQVDALIAFLNTLTEDPPLDERHPDLRLGAEFCFPTIDIRGVPMGTFSPWFQKFIRTVLVVRKPVHLLVPIQCVRLSRHSLLANRYLNKQWLHFARRQVPNCLPCCNACTWR